MRSIVVGLLFVSLAGSGCGGDDGGDDQPADDDMMEIDAPAGPPDMVLDPEPFKIELPIVHVDGTIEFVTVR